MAQYRKLKRQWVNPIKTDKTLIWKSVWWLDKTSRHSLWIWKVIDEDDDDMLTVHAICQDKWVNPEELDTPEKIHKTDCKLN